MYVDLQVAVLAQSGVLAMTAAQTWALARRPDANWAFAAFVTPVWIPCGLRRPNPAAFVRSSVYG